MRSHYKLISHGFSLVELLVAIAIIGVLSSIALNVTLAEIDRSKINSAQVALAGWLQVVQRSALLQKSSSFSQGGCTVTLPNLFTNQGNGAMIASVSPLECSPDSSLFLNIPSLGDSKISASFSSNTIDFTPRGTVKTSDENPLFEVRLLINKSSLLRCVRISGLAGVIEIGRGQSGSSLNNQCTDYTRI